MTTIPTDLLVTIAQDPAATAPLPQTAPLGEVSAPAPDEHETRRLPPLTPAQRWAVTRRIWADRLVRSWPAVLAGVGLAVALLALALVLSPPGRARALVQLRPTLPPAIITATPSLAESLAVVILPTATAEPAPAAPAQVVYVPPPPPEPTAEPAPLQPIVVAPAPAPQLAPTAAELVPIRVELDADGGRTLVLEDSPGRYQEVYEPPARPEVAAAPTPHFGALNGGGGSWDATP